MTEAEVQTALGEARRRFDLDMRALEQRQQTLLRSVVERADREHVQKILGALNLKREA